MRAPSKEVGAKLPPTEQQEKQQEKLSQRSPFDEAERQAKVFPGPQVAKDDNDGSIIQSIHLDMILGKHSSSEPGKTLVTDSFLNGLTYKEKYPVMLFDAQFKYFYRDYKFYQNSRPSTDAVLVVLNFTLLGTYFIKYVFHTGNNTDLPAALVWCIFCIDMGACLLNLSSLLYLRSLSFFPLNVHNYIDAKKLPPFEDQYFYCKDGRWDTWAATFLWQQRHVVVALKCLLEVASIMVVHLEQTFSGGTCTVDDVGNLALRLYWLNCNLEGVSQATSIFTAMRLILHPFSYAVLASAEFELIICIQGAVITFLAVCNLLTPSLAFLHPTLSYGFILGVGMLYDERNKRLSYIREMRLRLAERSLRDQTLLTASFGSTEERFVPTRQRSGGAFPPSLSSLSGLSI